MEIHVWFNLITLILVVALGTKGMINGFIKEVFGLIGIIGGIFVASRFAESFGKIISDNIFQIQNTSSIYIVGFVAILFIFWIVCLLFGFILSKIVSFSALTIVNRLLGFIFSALKVFLILSILIAAISYIGFIKDNYLDKYLKNSFMYESFLKTGRFIINLDYSSLDNTVEDITSKAKSEIDDSDFLKHQIETVENFVSNETNIVIESFMKDNETNNSLHVNKTEDNYLR